jgi:catechol 2,3-dioxygenase-like lactoylglutathione lyase family enzyme
MASIESISHSGAIAPDSRAVHEFYEQVFGGKWVETVSRSYYQSRGGQAHSCGTLADYLFVTFARERDLPPPDQHRGGADSYRHAFAVSRTRFEEAMHYLLDHDVPFEGPVTHPEKGPLGESIYFRDPGGNFFELCWRRDEEQLYNPVMRASV